MFLLLYFPSSPNGLIILLAVVSYPGQKEPFKSFFRFSSEFNMRKLNWLTYILGNKCCFFFQCDHKLQFCSGSRCMGGRMTFTGKEIGQSLTISYCM